mgnify:CR=1 FL=1
MSAVAENIQTEMPTPILFTDSAAAKVADLIAEEGNPELKLRPGMTATVTVRTREAKGALAVRNAALRFRPLPEKDAEGKPKPVKPPPPLDPGLGPYPRGPPSLCPQFPGDRPTA